MTITTVSDRDEENGATAASSLKSDNDDDHVDVVVVEMKERRNLQVLGFLLATAFMILIGAILQGTQPFYYQGVSTTSLFEERSLQGLLSMCAARRNKDFTKIDFSSTTPGIVVEQGGTKKYQTTVPKGTIPAAMATYPTTGQVIISLSYVNEKPPPGEVEPTSGVECGNIGGTGAATNTADCSIRDELREQTMFIWVDGMSTTTFTLKVGPYAYVYP